MNRIGLGISAASLFATLLYGNAYAEYRCDPPRSSLDRRACSAAVEGPDSLRRFIQRVRVIDSLYFPDYVSRATLIAWDEKRAQERAQRKAKFNDPDRARAESQDGTRSDQFAGGGE